MQITKKIKKKQTISGEIDPTKKRKKITVDAEYLSKKKKQKEVRSNKRTIINAKFNLFFLL
jgi:hypothetical protein